MKLILLLLFFTIHLHSYSQQKDRRKYIGDNLNTRLFAVSDEGKIIVAKNNKGLYLSESTDSTWKEYNFPKETRIEYNYYYGYKKLKIEPSILFSKNNQILINSALNFSKKDEVRNGFIYLNNNGKSWEFIPSPKNLVILNITQDADDVLQCYAQNKSRLLIFTSTDFGKTWKKRNTNFVSHSLIVKIQNDGNGQGILVLDNNKMYVTNSNWKHSKRIKTKEIFTTNNLELNLGNGKYKENLINKFQHSQVRQIGFMNDHYIILYNSVLYFTNMNKISWNKLPYNINSMDLKPDQLVIIAHKNVNPDDVLFYTDLNNELPTKTFNLSLDSNYMTKI